MLEGKSLQNTFQLPEDCLACKTVWREYNHAVNAAAKAQSNVHTITVGSDWGEQAELQELLIGAEAKRDLGWTAIRAHEYANHHVR